MYKPFRPFGRGPTLPQLGDVLAPLTTYEMGIILQAVLVGGFNPIEKY